MLVGEDSVLKSAEFVTGNAKHVDLLPENLEKCALEVD